MYPCRYFSRENFWCKGKESFHGQNCYLRAQQKILSSFLIPEGNSLCALEVFANTFLQWIISYSSVLPIKTSQWHKNLSQMATYYTRPIFLIQISQSDVLLQSLESRTPRHANSNPYFNENQPNVLSHWLQSLVWGAHQPWNGSGKSLYPADLFYPFCLTFYEEFMKRACCRSYWQRTNSNRSTLGNKLCFWVCSISGLF